MTYFILTNNWFMKTLFKHWRYKFLIIMFILLIASLKYTFNYNILLLRCYLSYPWLILNLPLTNKIHFLRKAECLNVLVVNLTIVFKQH